MCTVVETLAQRRTVAQSPSHNAAYNQARTDQDTYEEAYVRICMIRSVCFPVAWSSSHLQVACLHLECWTIYLLNLSFIPIHSSFRASVAGGTARYTKRLVSAHVPGLFKPKAGTMRGWPISGFPACVLDLVVCAPDFGANVTRCAR